MARRICVRRWRVTLVRVTSWLCTGVVCRLELGCRADELRKQRREHPGFTEGMGKEQPWVTEETVKIAERARLEKVEAARKARVRRRQEMKKRLKTGGVPVEDESGDDEDTFEGDDGMARLDYELVSRAGRSWGPGPNGPLTGFNLKLKYLVRVDFNLKLAVKLAFLVSSWNGTTTTWIVVFRRRNRRTVCTSHQAF